MKEANVWELRSGDVLARPIHSANGNVLLREGKPLTDELIKRLKKEHHFRLHSRAPARTDRTARRTGQA